MSAGKTHETEHELSPRINRQDYWQSSDSQHRSVFFKNRTASGRESDWNAPLKTNMQIVPCVGSLNKQGNRKKKQCADGIRVARTNRARVLI